DGMVRIWDARTGQVSLALRGHTDSASSVAFSPDGKRLASIDSSGMVRIWDARPLTEESQLERQSLSFFRFLAETVALKEEMLGRIRRDQTISEPVRQQALAWMEDYRESPYQLNTASWVIVRRTNAKAEEYRLALRQAEAASRLEP